MKKPILSLYLLLVFFMMGSCQDKTRDDAKFLGHYETDVKKNEKISTAYDEIDVTIDENDPEYPYLVKSTHHVRWFVDHLYDMKIDKKVEEHIEASQNCKIKEGILIGREAVRPLIRFEIVEKDGKFVKFILAINDNKPYIGTIKK